MRMCLTAVIIGLALIAVAWGPSMGPPSPKRDRADDAGAFGLWLLWLGITGVALCAVWS